MSGRSNKVKKHTIILVQFTNNRDTRHYNDYETVTAAMDGVCKLYEQKLRMGNPNARNFTYDIKDLYNYIDQLSDLGALVFDPNLKAYVPHNKDWIKERVFKHLKKLVDQPNTYRMDM